MQDLFKELERFSRYNRSIADEKKGFYQHIYLIRNSCLNHVIPHPESLKILQSIIESLESLTEVFKRVRKLKGSDLEMELVKHHEPFDIFYKQWSSLQDKQLSLITAGIKLDPDEKVEQLKERLIQYFYIVLDLESVNYESLKFDL